ncbi:hypothetical protein QUA81_13465 [Microcoleus sp. F6_B4]
MIYDENSSIGRNTLTPEDRVFIHRLRNPITNILLSLEFLPELICEINQKDLGITKGFGQTLKKSKALDRLPRWLGKDLSIKNSESLEQAEKIMETVEPNEETLEKQTDNQNREIKKIHLSPIAHWRRGHWRVLEAGEGKRWKKAKRISIKPIYVKF